MNILFLMIPITLLIGFSFVGLFFWANNAGQFDDLETPAIRILNNDQEKSLKKGVGINGTKES